MTDILFLVAFCLTMAIAGRVGLLLGYIIFEILIDPVL